MAKSHQGARVETVSPLALRSESERNTGVFILDCRNRDEISEGKIPGAHWIPFGELDARIGIEVPSKKQPIVIYCAMGIRSLKAAERLVAGGYGKVRSLEGGISAWKAEGLPLDRVEGVTGVPGSRYRSQLVLPGFGVEAQKKLETAKVLVVGAGGLGSPAALYLAGAGVGRIGIVDADVVEESNLHRQILHSTRAIGSAKTESAAARLRELNPRAEIVEFRERLSGTNAERIATDFDLLLDCTDNFDARYLINHAGVKLRKPVVHGSVLNYQGHIAVFDATRGPCYQCVFPEPPPVDLRMNCADSGVLGPVAGTIGSMMATEAIKLICGIGVVLSHSLLVMDASDGEIQTVEMRKNPSCPACSAPEKLIWPNS